MHAQTLHKYAYIITCPLRQPSGHLTTLDPALSTLAPLSACPMRLDRARARLGWTYFTEYRAIKHGAERERELCFLVCRRKAMTSGDFRLQMRGRDMWNMRGYYIISLSPRSCLLFSFGSRNNCYCYC